MMKNIALFLVVLFSANFKAKAEDGYRLWLRYDLVSDQTKLSAYKKSITGWMIEGESPTLNVARKELQIGLAGLLGNSTPSIKATGLKEGNIIAGTVTSSPIIASLKLSDKLSAIDKEGFIITKTSINNKKVIVIAATEDVGVLYGVFHFLRLIQTQQEIGNISVESSPKIKL
ncbi:MAG: alpha-glucuronidase, partial [Bacteroidia bacterium]|nr:alpha-glucuronidase [Bacteroidia bacterium]